MRFAELEFQEVALLSANPVYGELGDHGDESDEIHSQSVFAPGTSPEYVNSFIDRRSQSVVRFHDLLDLLS